MASLRAVVLAVSLILQACTADECSGRVSSVQGGYEQTKKERAEKCNANDKCTYCGCRYPQSDSDVAKRPPNVVCDSKSRSSSSSSLIDSTASLSKYNFHHSRRLLKGGGSSTSKTDYCTEYTCSEGDCADLEESMFGFGKYKSVTCSDVESSMNMQVILLPLLCLLFCGFLCFKAYQKYTNKDDASTEEETKALKGADDGAAGDSTEKSE